MSGTLTHDQDRVEAPAGGARTRRKVMIFACVGAVLAAVGTWLVAFSPVFGVKTVTVAGNRSVGVGAVRHAADIRAGTPLLRLDTGAVAARVEKLPDVASATVRVSYPNTVVITVTSREPVGYLRTAAGYVLIDRTGDQFHTQSTKPARLPLFVLPTGTQSEASGQAVAVVAASLPQSLLARVASIQAFDPTAITVLLSDGRVVRWGSAEQSAAKARILPALLNQPGTQFDVSDPGQPFARGSG